MLRNKLIFAKTNPMPSSVGDRLSCTWEVVYVLARSRSYFFDLDAIRVPTVSRAPQRRSDEKEPKDPRSSRPQWAGPLAGSNVGLARLKLAGRVGHPLGKNIGDVWFLSASNYRGGHYATFNETLVRRMLLAGCPEQACTTCGKPWQRKTRQLAALAVRGELQAACECDAKFVPGLVLDPFFGVGTVGLVAESLDRDWLGIELNPAFAKVARERIAEACHGEQAAA
ncbi:MAG TPA: site-specific DNA-methyltransferase [Acidimicrobiales bacterium]|nr:site-specific DNA-methyltransferase [Acidimicrobiales bacterium]